MGLRQVGRLIAPLGRHAHRHVCGCGTELQCATADCAVSRTWECPTCEVARMDSYFSQQEALNSTHDDSPKEHTR